MILNQNLKFYVILNQKHEILYDFEPKTWNSMWFWTKNLKFYMSLNQKPEILHNYVSYKLRGKLQQRNLIKCPL